MIFLRVLSRRHLAVLWLSQVLSAMGDYLYTVAVLWIAVQVAGSGAALVAAAGSLSGLIFSLLGGVYADRWNRRATMIAMDTVRGVAVLALPVVAFFGLLQLWHLVLVAVIVNGLGAFFDPALVASLPALADDQETLRATNGLMDVTRRLARILGPGCAGLLVAVLPLTHFFTLDAISFFISAGAVLAIGGRYAWRPARDAGATPGARGIISEVAGAVELMWRHQKLVWMNLALAFSNLIYGIVIVVGVPLFTDHVLHGTVAAYGLILGAYGVGNVAGNFVVGSLRIRRPMLVYSSGKILLGLGFVIIALSHSLPLAMAGAALAAGGGPMCDLVLLTMMQRELPPNQVGKAYSVSSTLEYLGTSAGLLLAVPLYAALAAPLVMACSAVALVVVGLIGLARFGVSGEAEVAPAPAETVAESSS